MDSEGAAQLEEQHSQHESRFPAQVYSMTEQLHVCIEATMQDFKGQVEAMEAQRDLGRLDALTMELMCLQDQHRAQDRTTVYSVKGFAAQLEEQCSQLRSWLEARVEALTVEIHGRIEGKRQDFRGQVEDGSTLDSVTGFAAQLERMHFESRLAA